MKKYNNDIPFRNGKKEADTSTLTSQVDNLNTSLAEMTNLVLSIESFPIQVPESNDTGRIQRAVSFSESNGGRIIRLEDKTYTVSGTGTIFDLNIGKTAIMGGKLTTIDASSMTSGVLFQLGRDPKLMSAMAFPVLSQLTIQGSISPSCSTVAIQLGKNGDMTTSAEGTVLSNMRINGFGTQLLYNTNTYVNFVRNVAFGEAVVNAFRCGEAGNGNSGETWIFEGCNFYGSPSDLVRVEDGNVHFIGCSFDYSGRAVYMKGGTIDFDHCHFEGNNTLITSGAQEYIYTNTTGVSRMAFNNCTIVPYFDPAVRPYFATINGSYMTISMKDCTIYDAYNLSSQVDLCNSPSQQTSRFIVNNIVFRGKVSKLPDSLVLNYNSGFEKGSMIGWATTGTAPTIDATTFKTGTASAKWTSASNPGATWNITQTVPIRPSENLIFSLDYYMPAAISGNFKVNIDYLDAVGDKIGTLKFSDVGLTTSGSWQNYTAHTANNIFPPTGAVQAKIRIEVTNLVGTIYLDNAKLWVA